MRGCRRSTAGRRVGLGPHTRGAHRRILGHLRSSGGPPQVLRALRAGVRGGGVGGRLRRRSLPAGTLLIARERRASPVQATVPEPDGDALAEVAAARACGRRATTNPAPRRFGLRRPTMRAAPAGHEPDCSCDGGLRPAARSGCGVASRAPAQVVVMAVVSRISSPAGEVTRTLARPLPGDPPEMGTCQLATPVASVTSSGESIGPRP